MKRRTIVIATVVASLAAVAAGTLIGLGGGGRSTASAAASPTPTSLQLAVRDSGGVVRYYPDGLPTIYTLASPGAVQFPAGTTYAEAITAIYIAQVTDTDIPGAKLVEPLPKGRVVWGRPDGLVVDLAAPYGYAGGNGLIRPAVVQQAGSLSAADAAKAWDASQFPWPRGGALGIPVLPKCEVMQQASDGPASCGAEDDTVIEAMGPRLPE